MLNVVAPVPSSVCDPEVKEPLVNVTDPVGVPLAPATVTVTVVPWPLLNAAGFAATVTVGVGGPVTVTLAVPLAVV
jgi:hypothetical protein